MKKSIFVILFLLGYSILSAQFVRSYGIKAGMTISNQTWDYSVSGLNFKPEDRTGLNIGVYMELLDIPLISIVTELNYIQKGMSIDIPRTTSNNPNSNDFVKWDTRIDYLNIAALAKLRFNYGILTPYLVIGPKVDYEIGKSFSDVNAQEVEDSFKKERLGAKVGLGTEINFLPIEFLVEILYDADFNELYDNSNLKVSSDSFDLRIGIKL